MSVTIRDVNTNEEIIIPPEGLIFGRTGGDADIQLDDNSISRRQARVSLKGGNWLVETIAVAQGQRPPRPVTLVEGQTFIVGQNEFEVVSIAEADQDDEESAPPARAPPKSNAPKPVSRAPTMKTAPAAAPASRKSSPPPSAAKRTAPRAPEPEEDDEVSGSGGGDDGDAVPSKGIGALFVGVPKGLAYYLVNVPKLLFNPLGTVRKATEEQPAEPMGKIELIGYALPALLGTAMLGSIAFGLSRLIGPGHFFEPMSFIPIGPAIGAVIGALIIGWFFHPVMEWIINKLQGESDARSRTNYFLQLMTLSLVLAVPNALGTILGSLPIPFINLLGPLLTAAASLVLTYVMYQWVLYFKMHKFVGYLTLAGGALTVIFAVIGLITGVIATIRGFGSGSSSTAAVVDVGDAPDVAEVDDAAAAASANAIAQAEKAGATAEQIAMMKKAAEDSRKMIAEAKKSAAAAAAAAKAADEPAKVEKVEKVEKPPEKTEKVPAKTEKVEEATVVEDAPPVAKVEPKVAPPAVAGKSGSYAEFARKRDAIERLLVSDPTVLAASDDLQAAYGEYLKDASEIDKKYQKEISKNANKARLYEHLRDAEMFAKTGKQVDQLANKLKVR